jgi:cell division protein FtsB
MKKFLTFLLVVVLFIGIGVSIAINVLFYLDNRDLKKEKTDLSAEVTVLKAQVSELEDKVEEPAAQLDCFNASDDNRIIVNLPCSKQEVSNKFELSGVATGLFENTLNYSIETTDGDVIEEGFTNVQSPDLGLPGEYKVQVDWDPSNEDKYELHVFEVSAQDGSRIHEVEIPVVIK